MTKLRKLGWRHTLRRRNLFQRLTTRLLGVVLAACIIYFVYNFISTSWNLHRLDREIAQVQDEIALIEAQNRQLKGEVEYAESDAYVERAAREQLGMAREGDTVVVPQVIAKTPTPVPAVSASTANIRPELPNWRRWWQALRGTR